MRNIFEKKAPGKQIQLQSQMKVDKKFQSLSQNIKFKVSQKQLSSVQHSEAISFRKKNGEPNQAPPISFNKFEYSFKKQPASKNQNSLQQIIQKKQKLFTKPVTEKSLALKPRVKKQFRFKLLKSQTNNQQSSTLAGSRKKIKNLKFKL